MSRAKDISEAHGLFEFLTYGTEIGKNLLIIKLETRKVVTYPTHICVEIGDDRSVVIKKDLVDDFIRGSEGSFHGHKILESARFSFKDNNLDYQSISTPTKFVNKDFKLTFLGLAKDDTFLYIKLVYDSPIKSRVGVRWAGASALKCAGFLGFHSAECQKISKKVQNRYKTVTCSCHNCYC